MKSTLVLATTVVGGIVSTAIVAPLWVAGVLTVGLIAGLFLSRMERPEPTDSTPRADPEHSLENHHKDAVLVYTAEGRLAKASASVQRLLGWEEGEFRAMTLEQLVHPDDVARVKATYRQVAEHGKASTTDVLLRRPDAWAAVAMTVERRVDDAGFVVHLCDISDRRDAERTLEQRGVQLTATATIAAQTLDGSDEPTLVATVVTVVREALATDGCEIYRTTGVAPELVAGVGPGGIMLDRRSATLAGAALAAATVDGATVWEVDGRIIGASGDDDSQEAAVPVGSPAGSPVSAVAVPIGAEDGVDGALIVRSRQARSLDQHELAFLRAVAGLVALARRRRGAEQAAFRRSRHDKLTGLVNREVFLERLQTSIMRAGPTGEAVAVLLIDLDHFKIVNDSLGHAAGDALLEAVSRRLSEALRPGDLLARFGGDEFVVLARRLGAPDHAGMAAERLLSVLERPFQIADHDVQVRASVGVSVCTDSSGDGGAVLQEADAALHRAKELGRERVVVFEPDLLDKALTRLRVEEELRHALANNQLRVFYQPIVDLGTGTSDRAEALVRWVHPTRGLVSPAEFIPISERTGLIEEIGAWVVDDVARQCRVWQDAGSPMNVSVNVSTRQLIDSSLPAMFETALERHGIAPSAVAVEVTEQALAVDGDAVVDTLRELSRIGIGIALDDFGTGLGSIVSLRGLPVDMVKIDKVFIDELDRSGEGYAIVAALLQLAAVVGDHVVAEGVESEAQLDLLRQLGCDLAQGYLFSPAVFELETASKERHWSRERFEHH